MTDDTRPLLAALSPDAEDRPAVRVGDRALSRSELTAAAAAVADRVAGASAVAIDATASLETIVAVTGCLTAGVPVVPVPPDSGPAERGHILTDSRAQLWLGDPREDVALETVPVDITARSGSTHREPAADRTAMIMYTSGTTGAPKGVLLSRSAV
ncbi:AMP-binding protein, partial [Rhodococcus sp. CX]